MVFTCPEAIMLPTSAVAHLQGPRLGLEIFWLTCEQQAEESLTFARASLQATAGTTSSTGTKNKPDVCFSAAQDGMSFPDPNPRKGYTNERERESRDRDSERGIGKNRNLTQAFFSFGVVAPSILENAVYDVLYLYLSHRHRKKNHGNRLPR